MARRSQSLPVLGTNVHQSGLEVVLPGYNYLSCDRYVKPTLSSVARLTEESRLHVYSPAMFDNVPKYPDSYQKTMLNLFNERILFLISTHYEIFPALYSKSNLHSDIKLCDTLVNLGRKSYQHLNEAFSLRTGDLLHRSISQVVTADKSTRRPDLIPEFARAHMERVCQKYPSQKIEPLKVPTDTYKMDYTVLWSDTDHYFHTNHTNYMRVCFDAMVFASLEGQFSVTKEDLAKYHASTASCLFQRETNPGDKLTIHVWENQEDPWLIHAAVETSGQPVFQYSVKFVQNSQSRL